MSEDKVCTKDSCWFVGTIYDPSELPGVSTVGLEITVGLGIGRGVTDIYRDTASTIGATSVGGSSPTSSPSLTSRHRHGTSNPSGARAMKHFGHTSRGFRP
jgi:hypothetical protein